MKVYLIRHGESEGNKLGINQGQRNDFPLTEKGREQARKIGKRLAKEKISAIYSSDLKRAKETAEIIGKSHGFLPLLDERLRERDFGDLETKKDILPEWKNYVRENEERGIKEEDVVPPNGESDKDHWNRIEEFLNEKLEQHSGETIVVVAHAGSNKVTLGIVGHFSKKEMYKIYQANTCLNELEYVGKLWRVNKLNDIGHLGKDAKALEIFNRVKNKASEFDFEDRWKVNKILFDELKKEGYRVKYNHVLFRWEDQKIPSDLLNLNHPEMDGHLIVVVKCHGFYQKIDLSYYSFVENVPVWDTYKDCNLSIIPLEVFEESQDEDFAEKYECSLNFAEFKDFYEGVSKLPLIMDKISSTT
ncbi:MAG: histidine phosphatase family protein [Nanoarchaeota archaeon]|nr:histidine phosphatase family protein [Nanoarchaeota archaeon]